MAKAEPKKFANLPPELEGLEDLAFNLWWSWHPEARMLFKRLNREAWKDGYHNPIKLLEELPADVLQSASKDPEYLRHYAQTNTTLTPEMLGRSGERNIEYNLDAATTVLLSGFNKSTIILLPEQAKRVNMSPGPAPS
ncbi:MAG: DUF3417 domain-containing protein [Methanotrichaceae archaeon]|nr:DUF3417 domain-containing protein [Methanotrichaceae archaeon]